MHHRLEVGLSRDILFHAFYRLLVRPQQASQLLPIGGIFYANGRACVRRMRGYVCRTD